jgi:hypothetical protein
MRIDNGQDSPINRSGPMAKLLLFAEYRNGDPIAACCLFDLAASPPGCICCDNYQSGLSLPDGFIYGVIAADDPPCPPGQADHAVDGLRFNDTAGLGRIILFSCRYLLKHQAKPPFLQPVG